MKYLFITLAIILVAGFVYEFNEYSKKHPCIRSHQETQYQMPASVVVGGNKYGGGVAVPIGNMTPIQVTVCDEYK